MFFTKEQDGWLIAHAGKLVISKDVDKWAYHPDLMHLFAAFRERFSGYEADTDLWQRLVYLRKKRFVTFKGRPKLGKVFERGPTEEIPATDSQKRRLIELYAAQDLPRDRLPHTKQFDRMRSLFNENFPGRPGLSSRQVWLLLVRLGKNVKKWGLPGKMSRKRSVAVAVFD